jgi:hypothetical protein
MDMAEHQARCQCGVVRVEASADPDFVVVCNCKACQRRTGSPFGEGAYFKRSDLVVSGDTWKWVRKADSGRELANHFCPACGTTVFWTLEMRPDHLGVAAGCFEGPVPKPVRAIWASEKHDWVEFPEDMPVLQGASPEPT